MVNCLAVCKKFPLAASAQLGDSASICIWDLEKLKLKHRLSQHEHGVSCCAFTDDGRLFVSVGDHFDHQLFVWDVASGI
jgi:WD40 repeat protein